MEITTENITTYEPIISIVEIELEELTLGLYELWGRFCKSFLLIVNPSLKHKQKNGCKTHPHNTPIPKVSVYLPQSLRRTVRTDCSACFLF